MVQTRFYQLILFFFCSLIGIFHSSKASAQIMPQDDPTPDVIEIPQIETTPISKDEEDLFFNIELAQKAYELEKSDSTYSKIIVAYQRLVYKRCLSTLHRDLMHNPKNNSPACSEAIQKLFEFDKYDLYAVCAQDGIDSASCRSADLAIEISTNSSGLFSRGEELDQSLETSRNQELISKIKDEIYNLHSNYNNEQNEANKNELLKAYYKAISISCKKEYYAVQKITKSDDNQDIIGKKPILTMDIFNATPTPAALSDGLRRFRSFTSDCYDLINRSLEIEPTFSSGLCSKFGSISPRCIEAMRKAKNKVNNNGKTSVPTRSGGTLKEDGLSEF